MVKALLLLPNGELEETNLSTYKDYQKVLQGNFELLPMDRPYVNPEKKTKSMLVCYVDEEGRNKQLDSNPWAGFLLALGMPTYSCTIAGIVIVVGKGKGGDDGNVDPYIVELASDYHDCDHQDVFLEELERLNKAGLSPKSCARKKQEIPKKKKAVVAVKKPTEKKKKEPVADNKKKRKADDEKKDVKKKAKSS